MCFFHSVSFNGEVTIEAHKRKKLVLTHTSSCFSSYGLRRLLCSGQDCVEDSKFWLQKTSNWRGGNSVQLFSSSEDSFSLFVLLCLYFVKGIVKLFVTSRNISFSIMGDLHFFPNSKEHTYTILQRLNLVSFLNKLVIV